MSTITVVTLTRPRHPFEGRPLPVLGSMLRHGAMELLVVLPDGSKRLIPAAWTDLESPPGRDGSDGPGTLGSAADLLGLSVLVSGLSARGTDSGEQAARKSPCKEDDRAAYPAQFDAGADSGATAGPDRRVPGLAGGSGDGAARPADRQGGGSREPRGSGGRR